MCVSCSGLVQLEQHQRWRLSFYLSIYMSTKTLLHLCSTQMIMESEGIEESSQLRLCKGSLTITSDHIIFYYVIREITYTTRAYWWTTPLFCFCKPYSIIIEDSDEWIATSDVTIYMDVSKTKSGTGVGIYSKKLNLNYSTLTEKTPYSLPDCTSGINIWCHRSAKR